MRLRRQRHQHHFEEHLLLPMKVRGGIVMAWLPVRAVVFSVGDPGGKGLPLRGWQCTICGEQGYEVPA